MAPLLDERSRRRWAASEARMIGHGGVSAVAEATGLAVGGRSYAVHAARVHGARGGGAAAVRHHDGADNGDGS